MKIKIPHVPFDFQSPAGRMRLDVAGMTVTDKERVKLELSKGVIFSTEDVRWWNRMLDVTVSFRNKTDLETALLNGFETRLQLPGSTDEKIVEALCKAPGVVVVK